MINDETTMVFVYGSLKRGLHNHELLTRHGARFVGTDAVVGYSLFSLGSFPAAVPAKKGKVTGELYAVGTDGMAALDRLEGCPGFYTRAEVETDNRVRAIVYVMSAAKARSYGGRVLNTGTWQPS